MMRSVFAWRASSSTGSVRSFVRKTVLTVFSCEGSTKSPTLSQLSAKEEGAKLSNCETTFFRFISALFCVLTVLTYEEVFRSATKYLEQRGKTLPHRTAGRDSSMGVQNSCAALRKLSLLPRVR